MSNNDEDAEHAEHAKHAEHADDDTLTCGKGIAQHAAIPAKIGVMFEGLAETFELHRHMLVLDDVNARKEDDVYRDLAKGWREIARLVTHAARLMEAQRSLPMANHDESKWGPEHLRAFEKLVVAQNELLELLKVDADRDNKMLASMKQGGARVSSDT